MGRTAHPNNFQLRVGLSREVTTDLELVPVPRAPLPSADTTSFLPCLHFAPRIWAAFHYMILQHPSLKHRGFSSFCADLSTASSRKLLCVLKTLQAPVRPGSSGGAAVCAALG